MSAPEKTERAKRWPVVRLTGNAAGLHKFPAEPWPPDFTVYETYLPESSTQPLLEALEEIGDAAKAQDADALDWATWAHELAQKTVADFKSKPIDQEES